MSFITKDSFPIVEIKKFLIGKSFCTQSEATLQKVIGVIQDVKLSFRMAFVAEFCKAFFKPVIEIQSTKGVWYNLNEIWIESKMPYTNYGGTVVMDASASPGNIKLPELIKPTA